jgi:hypothetical protein
MVSDAKFYNRSDSLHQKYMFELTEVYRTFALRLSDLKLLLNTKT